MLLRLALVCTALSSAFGAVAQTAPPARADAINEFTENVEGGWIISGWHAADGEAFCAMRGEFRSGTDLDIVVAGGNTERYTFVFRNAAWRSIQPNQELSLRFVLPGQGNWTITVRGSQPFEGKNGFSFTTSLQNSSNDSFPVEFMLASGMSIYRDGVAVDHFNLTGTRAGMLALARCAGTLRNLPHFDPFSGR